MTEAGAAGHETGPSRRVRGREEGAGDSGRSAATGSGRDDAGDPGDAGRRGTGPVCELCGGPVLDRHCKILCLNCGYQRDCSDP